ncbi:type II secretion system F family protein, partial [Candidatus Parcubacteria bacterium]|nr:type II secretion system F family protein [Candidatus Parcubacteria bacterium]
MPLYFYKAKNLEGKEIEGQKEASDRKDLTSFLKKQGYFLLSFEAKTASGKEQTEKNKQLALLETIEGLFGVPLTEKLFFTRNLAVMLKTGVSLVRSFEILSLQAKNKKFKKILSEIARKINKGDSLSFVLS